MNLNKICPVCNTEYLPHVQRCADCGAALLFPGEMSRADEEKRLPRKKPDGGKSVVREGDLSWLSELRTVLLNDGIASTIDSDDDCKKGCCGDDCRLMVASEDLERAQESIEEYFMEISPEFRTSRDLIKEGRCPACGSHVGKDARECPDCGLPLLIIGDESDEDEDEQSD